MYAFPRRTMGTSGCERVHGLALFMRILALVFIFGMTVEFVSAFGSIELWWWLLALLDSRVRGNDE